MTALIEEIRTTAQNYADRFAGDSTETLQDLYRLSHWIDEGDVLSPWVDIQVTAARELRSRIAYAWLHAYWSRVANHAFTRSEYEWLSAQARVVVAAFETNTPGALSDAVYRAVRPDMPYSQRGALSLSRCSAFLDLFADLVSVVPAEPEAAA